MDVCRPIYTNFKSMGLHWIQLILRLNRWSWAAIWPVSKGGGGEGKYRKKNIDQLDKHTEYF